MLLDDIDRATATDANAYPSFALIRCKSVKNVGPGVPESGVGDNAIVFKLPANLAPTTITSRINDPEGKLRGKPHVHAGPRAEDSAKAVTGETGWTLTAIPGQTRLLTASDHKSGLAA